MPNHDYRAFGQRIGILQELLDRVKAEYEALRRDVERLWSDAFVTEGEKGEEHRE